MVAKGVQEKRRFVILNNYKNEKHFRHLETAVNEQLKKIKEEKPDFNYEVVKYDNYGENRDKIKKEIGKGDTIISGGSTNAGEKIKGNYVKVGDEVHHHIRDNLKDNYFLGICHGAQAMGEAYGGRITRTEHRHMKRREPTKIESDLDLFRSDAKSKYHANHRYYIKSSDKGKLKPIAKTVSEHTGEEFIDAYKVGNHYGLQFHPERTKRGEDLLKKFLYKAVGYSK